MRVHRRHAWVVLFGAGAHAGWRSVSDMVNPRVTQFLLA
jgi:hypothetical protein